MQPEVEAHNSSASTTGKSQVVAQTPLGRMTKAAEQVVSMNSMSPHQEEAEVTRPNPQDAAPMDLTVQMATTLHLLSAALHTFFLHDHHSHNHDNPRTTGPSRPSSERTAHRSSRIQWLPTKLWIHPRPRLPVPWHFPVLKHLTALRRLYRQHSVFQSGGCPGNSAIGLS